ncbi:MAG: deaminase [Acidiferrobacterales bacterium]|nr:deaminase [Acidiferrobacterales bacterium]
MNRDHYGMELARAASLRSKDPSTQVGCCIMRPDGSIASLGYNGTAKGVSDVYWLQQDRDRKLAVTLHAELNAVLNSRDSTLEGCTAYVYPLPTCAHCAAVLAQSGVSRVVCHEPHPDSRWYESAKLGEGLLVEAGVIVTWLP